VEVLVVLARLPRDLGEHAVEQREEAVLVGGVLLQQGLRARQDRGPLSPAREGGGAVAVATHQEVERELLELLPRVLVVRLGNHGLQQLRERAGARTHASGGLAAPGDAGAANLGALLARATERLVDLHHEGDRAPLIVGDEQPLVGCRSQSA
jgi:hypothetical protein